MLRAVVLLCVACSLSHAALRDELIASANAANAVKAERGRDFYRDTFKPMALQNAREAAARGLLTVTLVFTEEPDLYHWMKAANELRKDDADFEGFSFTFYTSSVERRVFLEWA